MKTTLVARDKNKQIMWIRGNTNSSVLTYHEWREAANMTSGSVIKDGIEFLPPF